jgi:uncharacterized protein (DUF2141 family)
MSLSAEIRKIVGAWFWRRFIERLVVCLQRESLRAGFGLAASRSPEQISKTLGKLDETIAGLKARRPELASRVEAATNDTLRAVEPRIDTAFTNVKQSTLKKFLPEFLAGEKAVEDLLATLDIGGQVDRPTLCLPHLELALRHTSDLEGGRLLAIGCANALSRVADDMRRRGLKHDAIRRDLMTADERDAPQMGLRKLAGDMRLVLPPPDRGL